MPPPVVGSAVELGAAESTLEAAHQRTSRALRHVAFQTAFVEPLHARVKIGAGVDQPLRRWRKRRDNGRVTLLRVTKSAVGAPSLAYGDLARLDRALRQQPGDNMHDPRRDLQRLAGEADAREGLEQRALLPAGLVEV